MVFNKRELYLQTIKLNNSFPYAYYHLGDELFPRETVEVQLQTGTRTLNSKELYLEAIKLDNNFADAYHKLGTVLSPGETVQVQLQTGPRSFTKHELLNRFGYP
eukprot:Skav226859  [mRNA]  locus=scaffold455:309816:310127:+ [translate_table: standard]